MSKILSISMAIVIALVVLTGIKAVHDLNDGRIKRVVIQMSGVGIKNAQANNQ
jgi:uncharacterized protein YunC (DUF1805 family)